MTPSGADGPNRPELPKASAHCSVAHDGIFRFAECNCFNFRVIESVGGNSTVFGALELVNTREDKDQQIKRGAYFHPGQSVPRTGIYRALHGSHLAAYEVTLLRGATFPACKECREVLHFELVRVIEARLDDLDFRVQLYELPHENRQSRN